MTLQLYLDDCMCGHAQVRVLEGAGHQVIVPASVGLASAPDEDHFAYARQHRLVLVTENARHFIPLHRRFPDHAGVFVVYQDNDPTRDMTEAEIARAIENLLATGLPIAGQIHVLNHWRY